MKRTRAGFTIVEVLVVVAIIAILAAAIIPRIQEGSEKSRDIDRQGDLRTLQNAIELYKQRHGRYPAGCNAAGSWSGQLNTTYECTDGRADYIRGSTTAPFSPDFIRALPRDPKLNGSNSGYVYTTNADGTVYKLMAKLTVESEIVGYDHPFKSCDIDARGYPVGDPNEPHCNRTVSASNNAPTHCRNTNSQFRTSYGVWGGFANHPNPTSVNIERETEKIVCDIQ